MARFHYSPIPSEVLCNAGFSATMKIRYGLLLGAAFNREYLDSSLEDIAALWAEAEGQRLNPRTVGIYLTKMVRAGLIEREQRDRYTWRTLLLLRYDRQQTATAQPQRSQQPQPETHTSRMGLASQPQSETHTSRMGLAASQAQPEPHMPRMPHTSRKSAGYGALSTKTKESISVDVDSLSEEQQTTFSLLVNYGVFRESALDLAQRVALQDVEAWIDYIDEDRDRFRNPQGFLVANLGAGRRPARKDSDKERRRRRYTGGKYAEFIQH